MYIVAAFITCAACGPAEDPAEPESPATDELRALGYGAWDEDEEHPHSPPAGVLTWKAERASPRARIWADDRSSVHVIAPSGERLRTIEVRGHTQVEFARSLPGGRIIALSVDQGLTLMESDGTPVWQVAAPCHHEVTIAPRPGDEPGSRLFAVALHHARPWVGRSVRFDEVAFFEESTGDLTEDPAWPTWSTWEHREALDRAVGGPPHALSSPPKSASANSPAAGAPTYDYFHLNGIAFDGPETMAVCLRNVSLIAEISLSNGRVAKSYGPKILDWPHAPSFVRSSSGERSLLAFDNGAHRDWSRAVEISRDTGKITWEWSGQPERTLWSRVRGFAERLPNGHTLITESERGRALEVTAAGEVVWEFLNPETRKRREGAVTQRRRLYRVSSVPEP